MFSAELRKKLFLFHRGVDAAQRVGGSSGLYYCPICMRGFQAVAVHTGDLTLEHVPPASLGGKGLVLTCKECNNGAGHTVDAAMHVRSLVERFADQVSSARGDDVFFATVVVGGERLNVQLTAEEQDTNVLTVIPRINDPRAVRRFIDYLENQTATGGGDGETYTLTSRLRYHRRHALVGDLRVAFLAAFALFGYSYVFSPVLQGVRGQISHPDENVIDRWSFTPLHLPMAPPAILQFPTPACLVALVGSSGVFLPFSAEQDSFYNDWKDEQPERVNLSAGRLIGWPDRMEMRMDFR